MSISPAMPPWSYLRKQLSEARVMLLFSPELCGARDPLLVLEAALPAIDVIQVRPKPRSSADAPCNARDVYDWSLRVLDVLATHVEREVLLFVDDRVDVARALSGRGCVGVHLGQDDCPIAIARRMLGPEALIGVSTHDVTQVAHAVEAGADYLGFGPIQATSTKGYARGLGPEAARIASSASPRPVFAIGGIDTTNAGELAGVGRIAVGSAILSAADPAGAARDLRALLLQQ